MHTNVELVVRVNCDIGECPLWEEKTGSLYFIDLLKNNVHMYQAKTQNLQTINVGQNTGCIALRKSGGLIAGLQKGIYFLDVQSGNMELVASPEADKPNNRFNDGKCDSAGRFWAGTISKSLDSGFGDYTPQGALYCLQTDRTYKKMIDSVAISNGLAWTKDNQTMLYIDSPTKTVAAYDFELQTGSITNKRTVLDFSKLEGIPDGMCIDASDNLWIAFFGGGCIRYCDPFAGKILNEIHLPAPNVTCTGFGGKNYNDLYITTGNNETDLNKYPLAGSVFKCTVPIPGFPPVPYDG